MVRVKEFLATGGRCNTLMSFNTAPCDAMDGTGDNAKMNGVSLCNGMHTNAGFM